MGEEEDRGVVAAREMRGQQWEDCAPIELKPERIESREILRIVMKGWDGDNEVGN